MGQTQHDAEVGVVEKGHAALRLAASEVDEFVKQTGWDQPPALFALVRAADLLRDDPTAAARLGIDSARDDAALLPVEQEALPEQPLDDALREIAWPAEVAGCALSQEIVILPPDVAADAPPDALTPDDLRAAATHPRRREARLVVAVLRDGSRATLLRLRPAGGADGSAGGDDELLVGPDLAPNLTAALLATLHE